MRLKPETNAIIPKIKAFLEMHPGHTYNGSQLARRLKLDIKLVNGALLHLCNAEVPWLQKEDSSTTRNHPRYKWAGGPR